MECYNVITEEDDEDLRNINIPEVAGHHEVEGSQIENTDITASILVFPDWNKEFHVHVDASFIALDVVLMQAGEANMDHPIEFMSKYYQRLRRITQVLSVKDWPWCMHYRNLGSIC